MSKLSYHDVVVYVNGQRYKIFNDYSLELTCTRTAGWSLWRHYDGGNQELIGGEYEGGDFRIEVDGVVICGETENLQAGVKPGG